MSQVEDHPDQIPVLEGVPPLASPDQPPQDDSTDSQETLEIAPARFTSPPTAHLHGRQRSSRPDSCFHSVIDRQYCVEDGERCNACGRVPVLNWFYRCIVDTSAFTEPVNPDRPILSPWIAKAALDGHYTDEEVNILYRQKLEILEMAEKLRQAHQSSHDTEGGQDQPDDGDDDDEDDDDEDDDDDDNNQEWVEDVSQESSRSSSRQTRVHAIPRPPCTHRACHHCNPALHQRCWLSIDAICTNPDVSPLTEWDFHERPISDTRIVRTLGMRPVTTLLGPPSIYSLSEGEQVPGLTGPDPRPRPTVRLPGAGGIEYAREESSIDANTAFVRGDFASSSIAEAADSPTASSTRGPNRHETVLETLASVDSFAAVRELLAVAGWEHGDDADGDASHNS